MLLFLKGYFYRAISGFLQEFQPQSPLVMRFAEESTHTLLGSPEEAPPCPPSFL